MMVTMKFRAYCSNCDKDGGYTDCLVTIMPNGAIAMQHPEEMLPKGWRWLAPPAGKRYFGEPTCERCFNTKVAMGQAAP